MDWVPERGGQGHCFAPLPRTCIYYLIVQNITHMAFPLIATCAFGLEAIVKRELVALGYEARLPSTGRIEFEGDHLAIARSNLWLRCADRVLIQIGRFPASDFESLFEQTRALPWQNWIGSDACFPVAGRSVKSQLSSVPAIQRSVKKAIVEKLSEAHGTTLPETGAKVAVEISILNNIATLTIDTTGTGLHKRGYRDLTGVAPLRETLAAALVSLSFWNPERPLIDPFCGSGTICIEAAMIGRNLAPGLKRRFAAEDWAWPGEQNEPNHQSWRDARDQARELVKPQLEQRIIGTDIDQDALCIARYHANRAGVGESIHLQQRAFADLRAKRDHGCLITNPPYGVRIHERDEVHELYRHMPMTLRNLPTWSFFILTSWPDFEGLVGKKANRRRKLYNAQIECTYYQYHGPAPTRRAGGSVTDSSEPDNSREIDGVQSAVSGSRSDDKAETRDSPSREAEPGAGQEESTRPPAYSKKRPATESSGGDGAVFGGLSEKADDQAAVFANRLKKMDRHRRRWPTKRMITCYRVYNRDIPEIPLMVDRYEDCLYIAEYFRPHDRDVAQQADWLELMLKTAARTLDVPREKVFLRHRRRQSGDAQYQKLADRSYTLAAHEGGLRFEVNLSDYLDTGLFLDHRITRDMVRHEAKGKRVLNLFAYTGSFSVYAAAGGASQVTTVDLSNTYLDWAVRNFKLNGLPLERHRFVREDTMSFLEDSVSTSERYDLAIIDPPTYSNSKRTETDWDIQLDHPALLNAVTKVMPPGGVIYFSSNYHKFKLYEDRLEQLSCHDITSRTVPQDFVNKKTHRCWRMTVG